MPLEPEWQRSRVVAETRETVYFTDERPTTDPDLAAGQHLNFSRRFGTRPLSQNRQWHPIIDTLIGQVLRATSL
ncbi:uncharacterized protein QC763_0042090 [Podospora pseudopauciseta]|uniref:Uncharacterized protein n=1 Tax=Podospora pseudopauciseta TaxID=2093780 RepID=A0ABR0HRI1_9PEZI|nr:hypothetical protein QC763_0042090 [Podospora pseudopauciseta]